MTETPTIQAAAPSQIKPDPARVSSRVDTIHVRQGDGSFSWLGEAPALMSPMFKLPEAMSLVSGSRVLVVVEFGLMVLHTTPEGVADMQRPPVFKCSAQYLVQYDLKPGETSSGDADVFGMLNGPYTSYPYWREFVNNTLNRCGMPSMSLPPWIGGKMSARPFSEQNDATAALSFLTLASQVPPKAV